VLCQDTVSTRRSRPSRSWPIAVLAESSGAKLVCSEHVIGSPEA